MDYSHEAAIEEVILRIVGGLRERRSYSPERLLRIKEFTIAK
jgi:hypothetical protein